MVMAVAAIMVFSAVGPAFAQEVDIEDSAIAAAVNVNEQSNTAGDVGEDNFQANVNFQNAAAAAANDESAALAAAGFFGDE